MKNYLVEVKSALMLSAMLALAACSSGTKPPDWQV